MNRRQDDPGNPAGPDDHRKQITQQKLHRANFSRTANAGRNLIMGISVNELLKSTDYSAEALKAFGRVPLWKIDETTHSVYGLSTAQVVDADKRDRQLPGFEAQLSQVGRGDQRHHERRRAGGNIGSRRYTAS
jgi:hypothetical protein